MLDGQCDHGRTRHHTLVQCAGILGVEKTARTGFNKAYCGSLILWQIFEVNTDGTGLTQVTPGKEEDVDNAEACYLPDGAVIYGSTATMAGVPCVGGKVPVANFYRLEADRKTAIQARQEAQQQAEIAQQEKERARAAAEAERIQREHAVKERSNAQSAQALAEKKQKESKWIPSKDCVDVLKTMYNNYGKNKKIKLAHYPKVVEAMKKKGVCFDEKKINKHLKDAEG